MHNHLRDMGRDIAEELGRCAGETRRLWHWTEQVIDDLSLPDHGIIVRGIKMDLSEYNDHKDVLGGIVMKRLQLLDTEEGILEDIMKWVKLPNLIWLRWKNCPHYVLPSSILMKNLRVLQVSGRVLKTLWEEESQPPLQLRELEIYAPLRNIPKSIGRLDHLERIVVGRFLSGRVNLIELPEEFCKLKSLKALVLKECSRLKSLPHYFGNLTTLEHIDLSFCRNLERLPESFGSLMNLQHTDLSNCHDLKSLPDSFGSLGNLQRIDLRGCHKLKSLPFYFGHLKKLQHINLSDCHGLRRLPDSFGDLSNLQYIDLSRCHNLERLPESFGDLTNLQHINLSNCHDLETLPDFFDKLRNLQHIDLSRCHNLERLPNSLLNLNESKVLLEGCSYLTM
jgi:Leucine-rich repeat (LRR) protein